MEFYKQEHWSELSFSPPGDHPNSRIEPGSPTLQANFLLSEPPRKSMCSYRLLDKIRLWFLWPRQIFSPGSPALLALCPQSPYRICSPPVSLWLPVCPGSDGKESACNAGDPGLIPESGRSPGGGNDNPLQYSCLENPMDRGAWWATVHGLAKSQTQLR